MLDLVPFSDTHVEDAAKMVASRCRALQARIPVLPPQYVEPHTIAELLRDGPPGVAALRGSQLAGFIVAFTLPDFRGKQSVFCPEWGNGVDSEEGIPIYHALYTHLARQWMAEGSMVHLISILAHDRGAIEAWHWLGFGFVVADALRALTPVPGAADVAIRRAGAEDLDAVTTLVEALCAHVEASPTFLRNDDPPVRMRYERLLADPTVALWLADLDGEPSAFLKMVPSRDADASDIVRDEGTVSITGAYTVPHARGQGVASALLDWGIAWAREEGYVRCAVDFETMNVSAARFWTRHFQPVCLSMVRYVDERLAGQREGVQSAILNRQACQQVAHAQEKRPWAQNRHVRPRHPWRIGRWDSAPMPIGP